MAKYFDILFVNNHASTYSNDVNTFEQVIGFCRYLCSFEKYRNWFANVNDDSRKIK